MEDKKRRPKRETALSEYSLPFRKALLKGIGFDRDQISKPLIGVVNSWGEDTPGRNKWAGWRRRPRWESALPPGGPGQQACFSRSGDRKPHRSGEEPG